MSADLKELRIRNLLMYGDKLVEVSAIFRSHFNCESMDGISYGNSIQSNFKPIPLTEEWLLNFGFVKYQFMNGYFINTIFGDLMIQFYKTEIHLFFTKISYDSQGMKFNGRKFINNNKSFTDCKYVHQLQNLYFSLTGKELTIKL